VSGKVNAIQQDIHMFTMIVLQIVTAAEPNMHLCICGVSGVHQMSPNHSPPLPASNSNISFTEDLLAFKDNITILSLNDITDLPVPPEVNVPVHTSPKLHKDIN